MDEIEVVHPAYAAWNAGDLTPALNHLHPDSGARVQLDQVNEWHFRDGLIVRCRATAVD